MSYSNLKIKYCLDKMYELFVLLYLLFFFVFLIQFEMSEWSFSLTGQILQFCVLLLCAIQFNLVFHFQIKFIDKQMAMLAWKVRNWFVEMKCVCCLWVRSFETCIDSISLSLSCFFLLFLNTHIYSCFTSSKIEIVTLR